MLIEWKEDWIIKLHLDTSHRVWKDKYIKPEGKIIYCYIYSKQFEGKITNLNVGELQPYIKISNKGLQNNLLALSTKKYLQFREYDNGKYLINLLG